MYTGLSPGCRPTVEHWDLNSSSFQVPKEKEITYRWCNKSRPCYDGHSAIWADFRQPKKTFPLSMTLLLDLRQLVVGIGIDFCVRLTEGIPLQLSHEIVDAAKLDKTPDIVDERDDHKWSRKTITSKTGKTKVKWEKKTLDWTDLTSIVFTSGWRSHQALRVKIGSSWMRSQ